MSTVDPPPNSIQLSMYSNGANDERHLTDSPKDPHHTPQPSPHLAHHSPHLPHNATHPYGHSGSVYNEHVRRKQIHHLREPGFRKDFHQKLYKTPKEVVDGVIGAAEHKVALTFDKTVVLGIMAGMYVGFGGMFALSVAENLPTTDAGFQKLMLGLLFSFALVLIIFMGGELFTGNTMYLTVGVLSGKIKLKQALLNLTIVYFANWAGCCIVAYFFGYLTDMFAAEPYHTNVLLLAQHKLELSPGSVFLRAIPANWMVCVGVFLNIAAEDVGGKIAGMVYAVTCFASIGFEHCIANMFYVDLALMYGLDNSFGNFLKHNLILVTIGNIIGGAFFVGAVAYYVYCTGTVEAENKADQKQKELQIREAKLIRFTWDKKHN